MAKHVSLFPTSLLRGSLVLAAMLAVGGAFAQTSDTQAKSDTDPQVAKSKDTKHQADIDSDSKIGAEYAKQVEKEYKVSKNQDMIDRVTRIGNIFAQLANTNRVKCTWGDKRLSPFTYHFTVLQGDDVNAFSLPGGYIYVYEGLLKFAQSDDEVAGVLAHEVAHASLRHVATLQREQSKLQLVTLPLILASILGAASGAGAEASAGLGNLAMLVGAAKTSGWSLNAEQAADFGGLQYMELSNYEPSAMVTFMERLHNKDKVVDTIDWGIYRTHPPTADRVRALIGHMADAGIPVRRSLASPSYRTKVDLVGSLYEVRYDNNVIFRFGGPSAEDRAKTASKNLDAFFDQVPNLYEIRQEGSKFYGQGKLLFEGKPEDGIESDATSLSETLKNLKRSVAANRLKAWIP